MGYIVKQVVIGSKETGFTLIYGRDFYSHFCSQTSTWISIYLAFAVYVNAIHVGLILDFLYQTSYLDQSSIKELKFYKDIEPEIIIDGSRSLTSYINSIRSTEKKYWTA